MYILHLTLKTENQHIIYIMFRDECLNGLLIGWYRVSVSWRQQRVHLCKPRLQVFAPCRAMSHLMQSFVKSRRPQLWSTQCLNIFHIRSWPLNSLYKRKPTKCIIDKKLFIPQCKSLVHHEHETYMFI